MIVKQYIKDFEQLGFGMFVHFGLYSVLGKGEWSKHILEIPDEEYEAMTAWFNPEKDWAQKIVTTAREAGCRYITLTTRHHDGFSLYDNCGLNDYDAPHSACGRDLVREFVDACRAADIIPFFYHTLLDWREKNFEENFPEYLKYLRSSVEILCTRYGKIGGIWFDGMWSKPEADWEEDAMYSMIRSHQPDAMIINNTGLDARGALGHIELDSVTFEQGVPQPINMASSPKYLASEMCQTLGKTWGYGALDICYKSPERLIEDLCACRKFGANMLLNVGPMGNGLLRPLDEELFKCIAIWHSVYGEAVHTPRPCGICVKGHELDFILQDGESYYIFCHRVGMGGNGHVVVEGEYRGPTVEFPLEQPIQSLTWLDNGKDIYFTQKAGQVCMAAEPFAYGGDLSVRVAKLTV